MPKIAISRRPTHHINRRVSQSIFRAVDYAVFIGRALNLYVVLNLIDQDSASAATIFAKIRQKYRTWLRYRLRKEGRQLEAPTYIYALEAPDGHHHVNWAVHVPEGLEEEFRERLPRWLKRAQGECRPHDVHVDPIRQSHVKRLAKYIVKGTDPTFIDHFFLGDCAAPQGLVHGKRAGVSPSLGHAARRAVGFRPRRGTTWRQAA